MTSFPETELIIRVNGEDVMHVEPLNEEGMGNVLVPGPTEEEHRIALSMLADAMLILTGCRPAPAPQMTATVVTPRQLGRNDDGSKRGSHLRLVDPKDPQA